MIHILLQRRPTFYRLHRPKLSLLLSHRDLRLNVRNQICTDPRSLSSRTHSTTRTTNTRNKTCTATMEESAQSTETTSRIFHLQDPHLHEISNLKHITKSLRSQLNLSKASTMSHRRSDILPRQHVTTMFRRIPSRTTMHTRRLHSHQLSKITSTRPIPLLPSLLHNKAIIHTRCSTVQQVNYVILKVQP